MALRLLVTATFVSAVVLGSAIGNAGPLVSPVAPVSEAPIGHLQPRARRFRRVLRRSKPSSSKCRYSMPSSRSLISSSTRV